MIYELRVYTLHPGKQPAFLAHGADVGQRVRGDRYGQLLGYWTSEFGTLNQVFHLWAFNSLEERGRLLSELGKVKAWSAEYLPKARSMIVNQETSILTALTPLDLPSDGPNVYELRRYTAHPGKVPEWAQLMQAAAAERRKVSRIVGVWTSEIGVLNQIVHLWAYKDLNERAAARAQAMSLLSWRDFVSKVPPLLARMESTILNPAPFSPMQ